MSARPPTRKMLGINDGDRTFKALGHWYAGVVQKQLNLNVLLASPGMRVDGTRLIILTLHLKGTEGHLAQQFVTQRHRRAQCGRLAAQIAVAACYCEGLKLSAWWLGPGNGNVSI